MNIVYDDLYILNWFYNSNNINIVDIKYKFLKKIGSGAFGVIDKVENKINNKIYIIKTINKNKLLPEYKDLLQNEIYILSNMKKSQYIVEYIEDFEDNNNAYIVMEYIDSNSLMKYILKHKLTNNTIYDILLKLITGINIIHEQGIAHRDIKPENILYNRHLLKVIDFGFACIQNIDKFSNKNILSTNIYCRSQFFGTFLYMSPESIHKKVKDSRTLDIWAYGLILFQLIFKTKHYNQKIILKETKDDNKLKNIKFQHNKEIVEIKDFLNSLNNKENNLYKLLKMCLEYDPEKRITSKQIIEYLNNINKLKIKQENIFL